LIITKAKPFPEILQSLDGEKTIFLVGCSECATVCKTGGEEEVKAMRDHLQQEGKVVSGGVILDPGCNLLEARKEFRKHKEEVTHADSLLVMSCGGDRARSERQGRSPGKQHALLGNSKAIRSVPTVLLSVRELHSGSDRRNMPNDTLRQRTAERTMWRSEGREV